jgi:hypothetical protein
MAEVIRSLRRRRPQLTGRQIALVRDRICQTFPLRVTEYVPRVPSPLKDQHDEHVHAAAVSCGASYLLTNNTVDFTQGVDVDELPYEIYTPDEFFVLLDQSAPGVVREATREQRDYWITRRDSVDLRPYLEKAGLPHFAERVRCHLLAIDGEQ